MSHNSASYEASEDARSHSTEDKLVYMANQIGKFFKSQGEASASASIAEHITKFWDPRMRRAIVERCGKNESGLDPLVLQAIKRLSKNTQSG